jgi:hypothetical protein
MEKKIFAGSFKEQARPMEKRKTLLGVPLPWTENNRLVASSKLNQFLRNEN